ncbi:receptor-like protein 30 isoform X3 [Quercus suber]|uniref:receptor-like protein 30 isoform X3 n=1 Tax=Quercus suber TaxID=58331 RepID=UPI0032DFCDBA
MMMMKREGSLLRIIIAVTLTLLLCFLTADSEVRCIESERHALLNFKQHLSDPSNRLASWAAAAFDVDCCHWVGVLCHNVTGHVIQLRLRSFPPLDDIDDELPTDEAQYEAQLQTYERSVFGDCFAHLGQNASAEGGSDVQNHLQLFAQDIAEVKEFLKQKGGLGLLSKLIGYNTFG